MILETIAGRLGFKMGKGVAFALAFVALVAVACLAFWRGVVAIDGLERRARDAAIAERDAHWQAEIATSNAAAEAERRKLLEQAAAADRRAAAELADLQKQLNDLEARNAALPNGTDRGLGRDRVRLLNQ